MEGSVRLFNCLRKQAAKIFKTFGTDPIFPVISFIRFVDIAFFIGYLGITEFTMIVIPSRIAGKPRYILKPLSLEICFLSIKSPIVAIHRKSIAQLKNSLCKILSSSSDIALCALLLSAPLVLALCCVFRFHIRFILPLSGMSSGHTFASHG